MTIRRPWRKHERLECVIEKAPSRDWRLGLQGPTQPRKACGSRQPNRARPKQHQGKFSVAYPGLRAASLLHDGHDHPAPSLQIGFMARPSGFLRI